MENNLEEKDLKKEKLSVESLKVLGFGLVKKSAQSKSKVVDAEKQLINAVVPLFSDIPLVMGKEDDGIKIGDTYYKDNDFSDFLFNRVTSAGFTKEQAYFVILKQFGSKVANREYDIEEENKELIDITDKPYYSVLLSFVNNKEKNDVRGM